MLNKLKKAIRLIPYVLPLGAPQELRQVWVSLLYRSNIGYLGLYILSRYLWTPLQGIIGAVTSRESKNKNATILAKEGISEFYYSFFNLHQPEFWIQRSNYLYHQSLRHCLYSLSNSEQSQLLNDKIKFANHCKVNKLNSPAVILENNTTENVEELWSRQQDFIVKPIRGHQSRGFSLYEYLSNADSYLCYSRTESPVMIQSVNDLNHQFSKLKEPSIIQERIANHGQLERYSNGSLIVIRILSILNPDNEVEAFRPLIMIPRADMITADIEKGASTYSIDLKTGHIGTSLINLLEFETSAELPMWSELVELVKVAHQTLKEIPLIGWDIAITEDGPTIIEGNTSPSLDIHQLPPYAPFIGSRFYELFMYNLAGKTDS